MSGINKTGGQNFDTAGLFMLSLRIVAGWTYFSAFWRRLVLANKLDPDAKAYIGEKFNHFLPNALLIKPVIRYLMLHQELLWWFMLLFTIVEGITGLLFMLGLCTRLMSLSVLALALGILLGAGWLGTTCLDEWQIGVLGIASGFSIFLSGGGHYSLDRILSAKIKFRLWSWIGSGPLNLSHKSLVRLALTGTLLITGISLFSNQYFHGGIWGPLHNLSVKPHLEITKARVSNDRLSFEVFRDEGADVYGSFLIGISLKGPNGEVCFKQNGEELSRLTDSNIDNNYIAKVKAGAHSLVIPLGARATLHFTNRLFKQLPKGTYTLTLHDVSGQHWDSSFFIL